MDSAAKRSSFLFVLIALILVCTSTALAGIPTDVVLNKSTLLNLRNPVERISVTNPAIADLVLISPNQVQVNGLSIGETTVIVWEKGTGSSSFFDIRVMGDQNAVENRIREIAPNEAITVQYARDTILLAGTAGSDKTKERAEQIARIYAPKVINNISVDNAQQVLLQVKVVQIDKTALKQLGISAVVKGHSAEGFTNLVGAPTGEPNRTGIAGNAPALGAFNPLDSFQLGISHFPSGVGGVIQALATRNLAKLLAEPNLLVKSGQKGAFHAGSRVPYNIVTSTGGTATTSIVFVDVGVKLGFAPEIMGNGMINLKIDPAEVSAISGTLAVNGYPIIDTREVRTNVELRDGESLVLAGLLQEEAIKTMSKIPLLGDLPILGALFRSTQDEQKEKELVFFITPKIIQPIPPGTEVELPTDRDITPEEEKEQEWMPLGE